jgi:hypothetical protein
MRVKFFCQAGKKKKGRYMRRVIIRYLQALAVLSIIPYYTLGRSPAIYSTSILAGWQLFLHKKELLYCNTNSRVPLPKVR